jgi:DNA-binding NtrC family response regulator
MTHGSTRTRVLHWFVRGGTVTAPDGVVHTVDVDPVIAGRNEGAQVPLKDPEVSAFHCEFTAVTEGVRVKDLGSTNGTFLPGGIRITEAVLTQKTEVTVGASRLLVEPTSQKQRVEVAFVDRFFGLVGSTPKMRRIFSVLEKIAPTPLSLLILGETGCGKEVVARAVHDASPRKGGPFVVVDCGSIPATLAESILFGHEKGAFTGATERRKGAIAEADGGTLFLDELGELPLELQPKLLRVLAEREVKRVGASQVEPVDVRVLAATRRDLGAEMNAGRFRSDLFFRIAQVRVELPALRERLQDVPMLVGEICARAGRPEAAPAVLAWIDSRMGSYDWPGNVRELVNIVSVAAALADSPEAIDDVLTLSRDEQAPTRQAQTAFAEAKRAAVAAFERDYFSTLSKNTSGNVSEMARQSGMERHHVRAYLRKYNVER